MSFHVRRFNRAAPLYESVADVQSRMAQRLLELWNAPAPMNVLELGCGTGILTRRIREKFPSSFTLATDAAPGMLIEARKACPESELLEFTEQNAEGSLEVSLSVSARAPFDLIASSALVQWFPDLEQHLRFVASLIRSGQTYLLSGFARSNFSELNAILSEPPFSYQTFPGHDSNEISAASSKAGFELTAIQFWEEIEVLPSARDVLHRIQILGSTRDPREGGRLNRRNLNHLLLEYERWFSTPEGVKLTWKPWIAVLKAI